jgi:ribosomal protein L29
LKDIFNNAKVNTMKEYKDITEKELNTLLTEKRAALQSFRFGVAGSKSKNVFEGRNIRKEIARIMTELSLRKNK